MNEIQRPRRSLMRRIFTGAALLTFWTVLAAVLTVAAALICTVKILTPEHLTPLAARIANDNLDADISIGRIELAFRPAFPVMELQIDSVAVISHTFADLDSASRAALPAFADSLITFDRLRAAVDVGKLLTTREIYISDVELVGPGVNVVLDNRGRGNFDIFGTSADTVSSGPTSLPAISVRRFAMVAPKLIRYYDAIDSTDVAVRLARADLDGESAPSYRIAVDGRINSPLVRRIVELPDIAVGLAGNLRWDPASPELVSVEQVTLQGEFIRAHVDCDVQMGQSLCVQSAALTVEPIRIDSVLRLLPEALLADYGIRRSLVRTDMAVGLNAHLTAPFSPETDTVPCAQATLSIANSSLTYGLMRLHNISLDVTASLDGVNYDNTVVNLSRFTVAGPATSLQLSGTFGQLLSDPAFDCSVEGDIQLAHLPVQLRRKLDGAVAGRVRMNLSAKGRSSMLEMGRFHRLDVSGRAEASNLYYMKADTSKFVASNHATFRFGSQLTSRRDPSRAKTLAAAIRIDSVDALVSGVEMHMGQLSLGLGVENGGRPVDSTLILPMGGGIRIGTFKAIAAADSAGLRLRGLKGRVSLRRHEGDAHVPEISLNAGIDRMSVGAADARVVIRDANIKALTYLRPDRVRRRKEIKRIADSLTAIYPTLPPDSIYAYAEAIRRESRRNPNRRRTRIVQETDADYIDWQLSQTFSRYLNDWYLGGELSTRRASLRTPYFPLRNRLNHVHLAFSNDSIVVDSVRYRGGRSDLAVNGIVSNIRRSLTGKGHSPLKINFSIFSDTLDVNELAAATFAGAAYAEKLRRGEIARERFDNEADDDIDRDLQTLVNDNDTLAPLLIPSNIDANILVQARNIFYSDLHLHDFNGDILVYDGAANLSDLSAYSAAGDVHLSALYSAPRASDIKCGLGLKLDSFNIERFLNLVPAIDSLMPLMRDFAGTISADIAATVDIDSTMNLELPTLDAAVRLSGKDLAFIDPETYRTIGKWLRFRDKADNRIKSMSVQLLVHNNVLQIYPFKFDIDRYTLGVAGYNDLDMNFDYHISVLKSPLPFKFGVTIKGNPDKYKIRLGGAKFKSEMEARSVDLVDTVRVNLIDQIQGVFRRGVSRSRFAKLDASALGSASAGLVTPDTLSRADSLVLVNHGIAQPDTIPPEAVQPATSKRRKRK